MTARAMEWTKLLSKNRLGKTAQSTEPTDGRTKFESDIDRVSFSGSFRRLSRKTQVHPLAPNDHVHNRLTHSIEAARVGATLGKQVGRKIAKHLPEDIVPDDLGAIVQAACLAHDIGNPPFGHAGESAIKHWFESDGHDLLEEIKPLKKDYRNDLSIFEGNAQGFRILTQIENHTFEGGLRLTYATLAAFLKYPWDTRAHLEKCSAYMSESKILEEVAENVGLLKKGNHKWCRHPLAFLVEAADDICYAIIDLEDGVELKIVSFDEVFETLMEGYGGTRREEISSRFAPGKSYRVNLSRLRGALFDDLTQGAIEAFERGYDEIMTGKFSGDLFTLLDEKDSRRIAIQNAKRLASEKIYGDSKKVEIEIGCSSTLSSLLETFCNAMKQCPQYLNDKKHSALPWKSTLALRLLGEHSPLVAKPPAGEDTWNSYHCLRRAIDFVSGMTDNYAIYVAQQVRGGGYTGRQRP